MARVWILRVGGDGENKGSGSENPLDLEDGSGNGSVVSTGRLQCGKGTCHSNSSKRGSSAGEGRTEVGSDPDCSRERRYRRSNSSLDSTTSWWPGVQGVSRVRDMPMKVQVRSVVQAPAPADPACASPNPLSGGV